MRNSIIIPKKYEREFIYEAKREGFIKDIDFGDYDKNEEYNELEDVFLKNNRIRQNLFQMILLYDNIIFPDMEPYYDCSILKSMDNFSIYSFDDLNEVLKFDKTNQEDHVLNADLLKKAIIPVITKEIKKYLPIRNNVRLKDIVSEIYDVALGIENKFSNKMEELLDFNKIIFDLKNIEYMRKAKELRAPSIIKENRFFTDLFGLVWACYDDLC